MPKRKEEEIKLPSLDDLFSSQEERDDARLKKIYEVPISEIDAFPNHPYKVRDDEDMMNLVESVRTNGVITPATVRRKDDGRYEMLSGHRRMRACELLGLETIRAEIVEMTPEEATIFMVESNFQRSTILPSEKAFAYKMRMDALKRLPGRPHSENGAPVEHNLKGVRSRDVLAEEAGESKEQVRRYIRLTNLIPELLELVDDGKIGMRPAVELSYIPEKNQKDIAESIALEQCTPTHAQSIRMRRMAEEGKLSTNVVEAIMSEIKPNQHDKITLRADRFKSLLPENLPISKREEYIAAALEHYARFLARKERENER